MLLMGLKKAFTPVLPPQRMPRSFALVPLGVKTGEPLSPPAASRVDSA